MTLVFLNLSLLQCELGLNKARRHIFPTPEWRGWNYLNYPISAVLPEQPWPHMFGRNDFAPLLVA